MAAIAAPAGEALRRWYRPRRDRYPWRRRRDPYAVLVSEFMLQQTQAARVVRHLEPFLHAFPTVHDLAAASRADVVRAWDGLGYNRRAVALSEAARRIVRDHGGEVPSDLTSLRSLPGVGPYTAAAVASIGFGMPVAAIDTNVARVVSRVHLGPEPSDVRPPEIRALAQAWLDRDDPGGWNQAVMDLGRDVCRPRPLCEACPLAGSCRARGGLARSPSRGKRPEPPFAGSGRQVRGAVVRVLRRRNFATLRTLATETGFAVPAVTAAIGALHRDGIVAAGPAALDGRSNGRVGLRS